MSSPSLRGETRGTAQVYSGTAIAKIWATTRPLQQEASSAAFTSGSGGANACTAQSGATLSTDLASYSAINQMTGTNARGIATTPGYDTAGDMTSDGVNYYAYDGEGRVCAVQNSLAGGPSAYGYLYNAEGVRVAQGNITPSNNLSTQPLSCDPTTNGFTLTQTYVLGMDGEELTMLDGNNNWQRTNVYAAGKLLATYDSMGLHFHLTDPLGTRRMQLSGWLATLGCAKTDFQSLPFGDGLGPFSPLAACATADDATPLHFTGKERDTESGNDYFGARYYAATMGRLLSARLESRKRAGTVRKARQSAVAESLCVCTQQSTLQKRLGWSH